MTWTSIRADPPRRVNPVCVETPCQLCAPVPALTTLSTPSPSWKAPVHVPEPALLPTMKVAAPAASFVITPEPLKALKPTALPPRSRTPHCRRFSELKVVTPSPPSRAPAPSSISPSLRLIAPVNAFAAPLSTSLPSPFLFRPPEKPVRLPSIVRTSDAWLTRRERLALPGPETLAPVIREAPPVARMLPLELLPLFIDNVPDNVSVMLPSSFRVFCVIVAELASAVR